MIKIVNLSLETGRMPGILKQAILKPLLKKPSLDSNDFKNYRPISNLRFISKTIEKCVAKQLIQFNMLMTLVKHINQPIRETIVQRRLLLESTMT